MVHDVEMAELDESALDATLDEAYPYDEVDVNDDAHSAVDGDGSMGLTGDEGIGLAEIFQDAWDDVESDDPLAMLYLEPGAIDGTTAAHLASSGMASAGIMSSGMASGMSPLPERMKTSVTGMSPAHSGSLTAPPAMTRTDTLELETSAVSQLCELPILCGEFPL